MSKNIVLLFDGTWMTLKDNTSIGRMYKFLASDSKQVLFYDPGVGSSNDVADKALGGAFGVGVEKNILDGYDFLRKNYENGDKVYVFGFSRGAYTARSFVGFIDYVGICVDKRKSISELFSIYKNKTDNSAKSLRDSGLTFSVPVEFIGVFDTVKSIGSPLNWTGINKLWNFHNSSICKNTKNAYQALAIDEARPNFEAVVWSDAPPDCAVEQRWFAGSHGDIGGGYENEFEDLHANYVLSWMLNKAIACGLRANPDKIGNLNSLGKIHDSYSSMWNGWYKILTFNNRSVRNINNKVPGFSIDPSVRKRYMEDKKYRPKNLKFSDMV